MPELPEVETIRKQLEQNIKGKSIKNIEIIDDKLQKSIKKLIKSSEIKKVERYGKALLIKLTGDNCIGVHIKLTGQLIFKPKDKKDNIFSIAGVRQKLPNKHTRAIIYFTDGSVLYFNDIRRFGWMKIDSCKRLQNESFFRDLGPDVFQRNFTLSYFSDLVRSSRSSIKSLLMDQKKISGIGNIYANDALFLAGIHPKRPAESLGQEEIKKLYQAIQQVLKTGLRYKGASEINFVDIFGQPGEYQKHSLVYGKENKPCPNNCGAKIKRVKIAGRGTFFCPNCQK